MNIELAKLRWHQQKAQAKNRLDKNGDKILWKLSLEEWCNIWQESGKWEQRGVGSGKYCMSRIDDIGNYEVGNVLIQTNNNNIIEGQLGRKFPQKGRKGPRNQHSNQTKDKMRVSRLKYLQRLKDKEITQ